MWTTLQELAQMDLHIRREIVWFQNVCVLQSYILVQEMFVEPIYVWEQI
jgi:hypothetical protein